MRTLGLGLLLLAALAAGCSSTSDSDPGSPETPMDSGATACGTVSVPAHEAVDVRVTGTDCAPVQAVVMAAVGRGRAAYEVDDYACTPADAPDGDTFYDCVADSGARITFRYGAVSS